MQRSSKSKWGPKQSPQVFKRIQNGKKSISSSPSFASLSAVKTYDDVPDDDHRHYHHGQGQDEDHVDDKGDEDEEDI